jgi:hypothetical protein
MEGATKGSEQSGQKHDCSIPLMLTIAHFHHALLPPFQYCLLVPFHHIPQIGVVLIWGGVTAWGFWLHSTYKYRRSERREEGGDNERAEKKKKELLFSIAYSTFRRNEHPSVKRALPPVGWQRTVEHEAQNTTVAAWLNTVVIWKHPGHLTSMKNEFGL